MTGAYVMEGGKFVLAEPFKTMLLEARMSATNGWKDGLYRYLADKSPYSRETLEEKLVSMVCEKGRPPSEIIEDFVVGALTGEL